MKFYGKIGFWDGSEQTRPGVYKPKIVEREYYGDVMRNRRTWDTADTQNDNLNINNSISILHDLYLESHIESIKYVEWRGTKWKVKSLTIDYPRINIELGGLYNGQ